MPTTHLSYRERAIERGTRFIYKSACEGNNFAVNGFDYLSCFSLIASTALDAGLRHLAREMGRERARHWRRKHPALPTRAKPTTVSEFLEATVSADRLGVRDGRLKEQIRQAARRFTAQDFLGFDPAVEPPEAVPKRCRCGVRNRPGRKTCKRCKRRLTAQSRYETWMQALYRGYRSDRSGVILGTRYAEALRWLNGMRPYCRPGDPDFYYSIYAVTHLVYTLNDYGRFRLSPRWLPCEFEFLKGNLENAIAMDDPEMVGEFLDTLKAFGLTERQSVVRRGTEYLLSSQNPDGSWGDVDEEDARNRYHPTWTAVDGLRDYAWRGERLSFPKLKPLLERQSRVH